MKSASTNSFLVDKDRFGYVYGSILQYNAMAVASAASEAANPGDAAAANTALNTAIAGLAATNEIAAAVLVLD